MSAESEKKARLASALRANLARRKAQGRARAAQEDLVQEDMGQGEGTGAPQGEGDAPGAGPAHERRIVPKDGAG
ncbi:hypothetical protein [Aquabacter sp. CN5-332]|uniref:hypothetical protein n=1 Tax=Aquabacter sp. CN5-332 TaxID=3156608 RepID=UPI0032B4B60B